MEIFGIGPFELVLIALVAFMVLGPERIPQVMRQLGRWVRQLRTMTQNITREYGAEIQEVTQPINEVRSELDKVRKDITAVARETFSQPVPPKKTPASADDAPPTTAPTEPPTTAGP